MSEDLDHRAAGSPLCGKPLFELFESQPCYIVSVAKTSYIHNFVDFIKGFI